MSFTPYTAPITNSLDVFKADLFVGKVLFCTGGGSGICRGMTEAMMRHGADAVIVGRNLARLTATAEELSKATGRTCVPAQADVRKPQMLQEAVAKTIEKFGRIDFVICGAAGNFLAPLTSLSENAFRTVIEIDTLGTFNTIKATIEHVRKAKGSYINVSATLHHRGTPYQGHPSAAKAAVDALSTVLAIEEGPNGVRSNVLAPGPIAATEGLDRLAPGFGDIKNQPTTDSAINYSVLTSLPLVRVGEISDCANATVFLFSPAASYITGQVVVVDGGNSHLVKSTVPNLPPRGKL